MDLTPREMMCVYDGYRTRERNEWERVRMLAFYAASPWAKKGFKPSDVWIPTDEPKKVPEGKGTRKTLSVDEIINEYEKSGFTISKEAAKRIANGGRI